MEGSEHTSAESLARHVGGALMATGSGHAWKDLLVQVFAHRPVELGLLVPAVPEPLITWVLSGTATVEERELDGEWEAHRVGPGDLFLTASELPYELRWRAEGEEPFSVMHTHVGVPLLRRAWRELSGREGEPPGLREVSGINDPALSGLLDSLRRELAAPQRPSPLLVQGLAQALAVRLIRDYADDQSTAAAPRGGLPALKLRRVVASMAERLDQDFDLARSARVAGLSEFHFSRAFKQSTGYAPSRYFIRMRIETARRLLRESNRSVIEIGMEVGYSSPGHFSQLFRREVGLTPSQYRDHA